MEGEGDHHLHLPDENMMDGHNNDDTNNNQNNNIWDVVDSWLNLDPHEVSHDHHDDHHHCSVIVDDSSIHDDHHQNQRNVGGGDGIKGGEEVRSVSDPGTGTEFEVEDHDDHDDDDQDDELQLQIVWPSVPVPDSCSSCQVLREIVHTRGTHTTKLEIHGSVGVISHAVYSSNNEGLAADVQKQHMLDFSRQNLSDIKEYLKDYLEEHGEKGCTLLQEPLSLFYEALTTGYGWRSFDHNAAGPSAMQEETTMQQVPTGFKSDLALQRQRVKKMKLEDFAKYFDKRINDASEELQICATVIKKKLRSYNISRWPYRKVESMKRRISYLKAKYANVRCRKAEAEVQKLQQKLDDILSGKLKP